MEPEVQTDAGVAEVHSRAASRRRRRLVVGAFIAGVIVVAAAVVASTGGLPSAPAVKGRGLAPTLELENIRPGEAPVSLAAARGKPVVLNFWASWCVPCRREMPSFQAVHEATKERVTFLGVNHQDQRGPALKLLAETGVRYSSGYDPAGGIALAYGLYGMPTTVFISADGQLLERKTGEISRDQLEASIDRLFGEASFRSRDLATGPGGSAGPGELGRRHTISYSGYEFGPALFLSLQLCFVCFARSCLWYRSTTWCRAPGAV